MYSRGMAEEEDILVEHPDMNNFEMSWPLLSNLYDIVFCGGAVGRNYLRESYCNNCESQCLRIL